MIFLRKNLDLLEKEKEIQKKKVVEHECCFESKDAFIEHPGTIFVLGFDCSFPKDDIKSALIKQFSLCGKISSVSIPFHCKTGSPLGFAFINFKEHGEKALTLNGSYLGGLRLEVTMAIEREEYDGYTYHKGCERCAPALRKHHSKLWEESFRRPRFNPTVMTTVRQSLARSGNNNHSS